MRHIGHASIRLVLAAAALVAACASPGRLLTDRQPPAVAAAAGLRVEHDEPAGTVSVFRSGSRDAVVTLYAGPTERPYLVPLAAPSLPPEGGSHKSARAGGGALPLEGGSQGSAPADGGALPPEGGSHGAAPVALPPEGGRYGLFWEVPPIATAGGGEATAWRRVSVTLTRASGDEVRWETVYELLDGDRTILVETDRWAMREDQGRWLLDLEWRGEAKVDLSIRASAQTAADPSAAALLRPEGLVFRPLPSATNTPTDVVNTPTDVVNAARQRNARADGQRAMWIDVGLPAGAAPARVHVSLFDHPANRGYPQAWRVSADAGVGTIRPAIVRSMAPGETETIRHRAVIYTGVLDDVAMTTAWSEFSGSRSTYATSALWAIAQREGRQERFLTGSEAAAAMTTLPGYEVQGWASEPMVEQPMAFAWDDRGRLWVAENLDYEARGRGFSNDGRSRVVILEDTDRDGTADRRTVFLENIVFPSALAVGFDGVFLGAPPNLLFVPDRDHDDKADVAGIEVRLTGWGIDDRHEVMNSLHWGPDGWLYGLQGFATSSKIRKPSGDGRLFKAGEPFPENLLEGDGVEINGGVWRYHPTKDRFEVVAHGFSNPWGIDYDAKGQLLMSACVIPHLWHVVPGGVYQRQGGQHFNPYVYADIQTIADHRHRSAHGGARVYQSDAFPASQVGRVFMANIHEHAVLSDVLTRSGSGFTARHGDDFVLANNAQWVGFSLEVGPDGALYVLDWHDADICGAEVEHHETGRIFRIAPTLSLAESWPGRYADLRTMSDAQLVSLQTSRSDWHARRARVLLQGRAAAGRLDAATHGALRTLFDTTADADWRLRAMWASGLKDSASDLSIELPGRSGAESRWIHSC